MLIKFNTGRCGNADNLDAHDKYSRSVCHMIEVSESETFLVQKTGSGFLVYEGQIIDEPEPAPKKEKADGKTDEGTLHEKSEKAPAKEGRRNDETGNTARTKRGFGSGRKK